MTYGGDVDPLALFEMLKRMGHNNNHFAVPETAGGTALAPSSLSTFPFPIHIYGEV